MTQTLITIEKAELDDLRSSMAEIRNLLKQVTLTPLPEWMTRAAYAEYVGKHPSTVQRWADQGMLTTREEGGVLMIRRQT